MHSVPTLRIKCLDSTSKCQCQLDMRSRHRGVEKGKSAGSPQVPSGGGTQTDPGNGPRSSPSQPQTPPHLLEVAQGSSQKGDVWRICQFPLPPPPKGNPDSSPQQLRLSFPQTGKGPIPCRESWKIGGAPLDLLGSTR